MAVGNLTISELSPEVAELLGLDFSGDFTKGELMTLMKTYLVMNHPDRGSSANEEGFRIVSEERKRFIEADTERSHKIHVKKTVIGKENYGEFVDNMFNAKRSAGKTQDIFNSDLPALPGSKGSAIVKRDSVNIEKFKPTEQTQENFDDILKGIDSILESLKEENTLAENKSDADRLKEEERKRKAQENKLEKPFEKLGGVVGAVLKPVKSLWEKIWNFIWNVFLGRTVVKLFEWFGKEENKKSLEAIGVFLKNTWPAILAAFLVFGTGLGGFIKGIVGLTTKFIPKIVKMVAKLAKSAVKFAISNPLAALAIAGGVATVAGLAQQATSKSNDEERAKEGKTQLDDTQEFGGISGDPMSVLGRNEGGPVPGTGDKDTVPAMLTPGEFVMSKGAVQQYGIDTLESMNAMGGGTNLPERMNGITYASGGGMIGGGDKEKKEKMPPEHDSLMGYRLGQINPETFVMSKDEMMDNLSSVQGVRQPRGQGGKVLGSTTSRGNLGTRLYQNGHLTESFNRFRNVRKYGKPEGIMRGLAGLGDLLTGDLFDFDRRTDRGNVWEDRLVTEEMGDDYRLKDDVTIKEGIAAIGKPDLIKHKDQILDQLPEGTTIQDVMSGDIPGVTSDQLLRILATSDAQKATNLKQMRARRLDEAIRGIEPGQGYSMMIGDSQQRARRQAETKANKRHSELMQSTDPEKIAAYDKKHGEGAYSHDLKEKLYRTYSPVKKNTSAMKLGGNAKKTAPPPPQRSRPSVTSIASMGSNNSSGGGYESESSGIDNSRPSHTVPRGRDKAKTLGVLI